MRKIALFVFIFLITACSAAYSQTDSVYIVSGMKVQFEKNKYILDESFTEYDYYKFFLSNEYLTANPKYYNFKVRLNDVKSVSVRNGMHGETGALIGAGIGFISGFYFFGQYESWYFRYGRAFLGGMISAVPFGLIGGLIGLFFPNYDRYDIYKVTKDKKRKYLDKILRLSGD